MKRFMKRSHLFVPTLKTAPAQAHLDSHKLMLRAGLVQQIASGIYAWLPLGLRVLRKIEQTVREEQDKIGCQEMLFPTVQPESLWEESGRSQAYGEEMLRFKDRQGRAMLYGPTAEEIVTDIFRKHVQSYKDLPKAFYNIQWKFRDEMRPRFGVLRGREFLMKDAYTFDLTHDGAMDAYWAMYRAYVRTFRRLGLTVVPMRQADTGPIGGNKSHEFLVITPEGGETKAFYDIAAETLDPNADIETFERLYAVDEAGHDPAECPVPSDRLKSACGIEVGHIFYLGTAYSKSMGATVSAPNGEPTLVEMGCHGIGVSRLVGAIVEACHDARGIIWPEAVAPYAVNLLLLEPELRDAADALYQSWTDAGIEVLYDDRADVRPGEKLAEADLLGMPYQVLFGKRYAETGHPEIKLRSGASLSFEELSAKL